MNRVPDVPGAINLRDSGGYATVGARVRSGVLYRSGMLAELTPAGQAALRDLGVALIRDLRRDEERTVEPTRASTSRRRRRCPACARNTSSRRSTEIRGSE